MARPKYPYQVVLDRDPSLPYDVWLDQWREFSNWCDANIGRCTDTWEFYRSSLTNTFMFTTDEARTIFLLKWGKHV